MQLSANRIAIVQNPTTEGRMEFWPWHILRKPDRPDAPLAGLHRERIAWPGSTRQTRAESRRWLLANGYTPSFTS